MFANIVAIFDLLEIGREDRYFVTFAFKKRNDSKKKSDDINGATTEWNAGRRLYERRQTMPGNKPDLM